jgi:hypothetical protein
MKKNKTPRKFAKTAHAAAQDKKAKTPALPGPPPRKMRKDKECHLLAINKFVSEYIRLQQRFPTQVEIARNVGLSRESIRSLIQEIDLEDIAGAHITRIRTNEFIGAIFSEAQTGNIPAAKLWLQLVYNWIEKTGVAHSGEIGLIVPEDYRPKIKKP